MKRKADDPTIVGYGEIRLDGLEPHRPEVPIFEDDLDELALNNSSLQLLQEDLSIENNVDYKIAYNLTEQRSLEMKLEKSLENGKII